MTTRRQVEKRMAELGVEFYDEEYDKWRGDWTIVLTAPEGMRFVSTETVDVVLVGTKPECWKYAMQDMSMGVEDGGSVEDEQHDPDTGTRDR